MVKMEAPRLGHRPLTELGEAGQEERSLLRDRVVVSSSSGRLVEEAEVRETTRCGTRISPHRAVVVGEVSSPPTRPEPKL